MPAQTQTFSEIVTNAVQQDSLLKVVFSKPVRKSPDQASRVDVRPVTIGGEIMFQFASRIGRQEHHDNLSGDAVRERILKLAGNTFRDIRLETDTHIWVARYSKKGACSLGRELRSTSPVNPSRTEHDRQRCYILPDGVPCPFLTETGIMTADGRVKAKHFRKFRQINRYLEFVRDILHELPETGELSIVDFGCGKSYLTFAVHHYLTQILHREVDIVGLDQRQDVVDTCTGIADRLMLQGIRFQVGDIAGYQPDRHVHLAVSLHACDTATDDALASAVSWNADVVFAVPCCQHELAAVLSTSAAPVLCEQGILRERFAAMATDAVRAKLMTCMGYSTQIIEFIDMEHTPKNLLIRAVRRTSTPRESVSNGLGQLHEFCDRFQLPKLRLQRVLETRRLLETDN